jgi:hypothetical protein
MPGKPLDKLLSSLRPEVPSAAPAALPPEPTTPRVSSVVDPQGFLAMIEMMRECGRYDFADVTLRGIYDTVEKVKAVTAGQRDAVLKIRHSIRNWEEALD